MERYPYMGSSSAIMVFLNRALKWRPCMGHIHIYRVFLRAISMLLGLSLMRLKKSVYIWAISVQARFTLIGLKNGIHTWSFLVLGQSLPRLKNGVHIRTISVYTKLILIGYPYIVRPFLRCYPKEGSYPGLEYPTYGKL